MSTDTHENSVIQYLARVDATLAGKRLDQAVAKLFPDYSRSRLKIWIEEGRVLLNNQPSRPREKVMAGDRIELRAVHDEQVVCQPQPIPLQIVFEDEHLLVVNKPADLVVHPAAGNPDGTLQNGLLHHDPSLVELPRAGIVHRLDKDTTGLMVIGKTQFSYQRLVAAMAAREVRREYRALVAGRFRAGGVIDQPIGRHPTQRTRMAVNPLGKPARTHFRVLEHLGAYTLLAVTLETGRTHQIRVHMAYVRHPVFGDPVYGGRLQLPAGADEELKHLLRTFGRQALHARRLGLVHPVSGREMQWEAPLPVDMSRLLQALRDDAEDQPCDPDDDGMEVFYPDGD